MANDNTTDVSKDRRKLIKGMVVQAALVAPALAPVHRVPAVHHRLAVALEHSLVQNRIGSLVVSKTCGRIFLPKILFPRFLQRVSLLTT